jgi:hypothetical protein
MGIFTYTAEFDTARKPQQNSSHLTGANWEAVQSTAAIFTSGRDKGIITLATYTA